MLAEAYEELSVEPPKRPFSVLSDIDALNTLPLGDGTVGAPDDVFDRAISESS
jgi:hypothetical protein